MTNNFESDFFVCVMMNDTANQNHSIKARAGMTSSWSARVVKSPLV